MKNLTNLIHAMLQGVKIGDRWGLPVECLTRMQILARTDGRGVTKLEDACAWRPKLKGKFKFAATSDDWQLTGAVGWCLAEFPDASPTQMAWALVKAKRETLEGWGGTTVPSVCAREEWVETDGRAGLAPHKAPPRPAHIGAGVGCGVAMRMSAIAAVCVLRNFNDTQVVQACLEHGKLTHPDPRAWIGAAALTLQLVWLLRGEAPETNESWLLRLVNALEDVEHACIAEYGGLPASEPRVCAVLQHIMNQDLVNDRDRLLAEVGNECPTFQSVPFAIATFLRCRHDFPTGILETINDGGDADSVGCMVGASLGAYLGLEAIPSDWIRPEDQDAAKLAHKLVAAVGRMGNHR